MLKLLGLVREHEFKRDIFLLFYHFDPLAQLFLRADVAPLSGVVELIFVEFFLLLKELLFFLYVIYLRVFTHG